MILPAITPGPWAVVGPPSLNYLYRVIGADKRRVVETSWHEGSSRFPKQEISEANSKAITAVPWSLKALLPFAEAANALGAEVITDLELVLFKAGSQSITVGDLIDAAAALRLAGATE